MDLNFQDGQTLLLNKPKGWTSFDVVRKVRNTIRIKKVGHAGTLDPLATGLLILCTGKHTKQINTIQDAEKEYEVIFKLGATTPCYDAELPEENIQDASHITAQDIENALPQFRGDVVQIPPLYSAVKINGQRAYKAARKGNELKLKPRTIHVFEFELTEFESIQRVHARIRCSKGTYIRSLVHDLGQTLGVGGYILELKRTRIGNHKLEDAWEVLDFVDMVKDLQNVVDTAFREGREEGREEGEAIGLQKGEAIGLQKERVRTLLKLLIQVPSIEEESLASLTSFESSLINSLLIILSRDNLTEALDFVFNQFLNGVPLNSDERSEIEQLLNEVITK